MIQGLDEIEEVIHDDEDLGTLISEVKSNRDGQQLQLLLNCPTACRIIDKRV